MLISKLQYNEFFQSNTVDDQINLLTDIRIYLRFNKVFLTAFYHTNLCADSKEFEENILKCQARAKTLTVNREQMILKLLKFSISFSGKNARLNAK